MNKVSTNAAQDNDFKLYFKLFFKPELFILQNFCFINNFILTRIVVRKREKNLFWLEAEKHKSDKRGLILDIVKSARNSPDQKLASNWYFIWTQIIVIEGLRTANYSSIKNLMRELFLENYSYFFYCRLLYNTFCRR